MYNPFFKYNAIDGAIFTASVIGFYDKFSGKTDNMWKHILIGAGVGLLVGGAIDYFKYENAKNKGVTDHELEELSKSLTGKNLEEYNNSLKLLNESDLNQFKHQQGLKVLKAILLANKDGKWDANGTMEQKKAILKGYGINDDEFSVFENAVFTRMNNIVSNMIGKQKVRKFLHNATGY